MAKKNKRTVHSANVLFADEAETNEAQESQRVSQTQDETQKSFWSGLGRGERIAAISVCLLLVVGALGAGLGNRIISVFSSKDSTERANLPAQNSSYLSALNPFPDPSPTPLPLSKEYIYAGSRMLAVEDANANAAPPADLAVWRPSTGYWYVLGGTGSAQTSFQWGGTDDLPVPGDYDGDGKTDFSVFRKPTGFWYVSNSSNGATTQLASFGAPNDLMAQADYDGDGKTDMGVYRPSTGYWYIMLSSTGSMVAYQWGVGGFTPVSADFDGDGKADIAVWYNTAAQFLILKSSTNYNIYAPQTIQFGQSGDTPVVGDYDGDGKADAGVWRPASATNGEAYHWKILYSSDQSIHLYPMGDPATDKAVQNDYDGDGKVDVAIWRPSNGTWYIQQSSLGGQARNVQWGQAGDVPVPAYYRR